MLTNKHGANCNCGIQVATEVHIANNSRVWSALDRFEFVNDLHRSHFGRSTHGAGRQCCTQYIDRSKSIQQLSRYLRRQVHHMAVALKRHELVYIHRSKLGNTTNIVARQIHQHHMLGNLFWIFLQLGRQFAIVLLVDTALASARNWSTHHFAIAQLHQRLGRATNNGQFGMLDVIHIRTWVDLTQHAVHIKRIGIQSNIKSLREHDLKNIASLDVLFCG